MIKAIRLKWNFIDDIIGVTNKMVLVTDVHGSIYHQLTVHCREICKVSGGGYTGAVKICAPASIPVDNSVGIVCRLLWQLQGACRSDTITSAAVSICSGAAAFFHSPYMLADLEVRFPTSRLG